MTEQKGNRFTLRRQTSVAGALAGGRAKPRPVATGSFPACHADAHLAKHWSVMGAALTPGRSRRCA